MPSGFLYKKVICTRETRVVSMNGRWMYAKKLSCSFCHALAYLPWGYEPNRIFDPCREIKNLSDFYRQALLNASLTWFVWWWKLENKHFFLKNKGTYPQRLKPSIKNALDYVPSLPHLIITLQWLILPLPKLFKAFHLAREKKTRKTAALCEWVCPSKITHQPTH